MNLQVSGSDWESLFQSLIGIPLKLYDTTWSKYGFLEGTNCSSRSYRKYGNVQVGQGLTTTPRDNEKFTGALASNFLTPNGQQIISEAGLNQSLWRPSSVFHISDMDNSNVLSKPTVYANGAWVVQYAEELEPSALLLLGQFGTISTVLNRRLRLWAIVMTVSRASWAHRLKDSGEVLQLLQYSLTQSQSLSRGVR